jgi:hypothetical protein
MGVMAFLPAPCSLFTAWRALKRATRKLRVVDDGPGGLFAVPSEKTSGLASFELNLLLVAPSSLLEIARCSLHWVCLPWPLRADGARDAGIDDLLDGVLGLRSDDGSSQQARR